MCGVYLKINKYQDIDTLEFKNNLLKLSHRGPDNYSCEFFKNLGIGHTRLSLLDLTSAANQPFGDTNYRLIFNGEIYNYLELSKKYLNHLELKTTSDTEVLFELLKRYNYSILSELNGMFGFVFYNIKENKILFSRDRIGIKPLYYTNTFESFEISSEIKALNYNLMHFHLSSNFTNMQILPYNDVIAVEPGSYGIFCTKTFSLEFHNFVNILQTIDGDSFSINKNRTLNNLVDILDELLHKSVATHLKTDAKIGALCSGGVDSSLISAIALKYNNIDLYHAGIEGNGGEEKYAEIVSKALNKEVIYTKMSEEEYWNNFSKLTYISDLPIYHPNDVCLNQIASKIKNDGKKALLTGEGSDELFGGYTWHQRLMKQYRLGKILQKKDTYYKKLIEPSMNTLLNGFDPNNFDTFMPMFLGYSNNSINSMAKGTVFAHRDFRSWKRWNNLKTKYDELPIKDMESYMLSVITYNMYDHLGSILHRTDRILMANSIEGRVPFLENNILNFALNLPLNKKIKKGFKQEGKYILKKVAEKYLPHEVVYREKMGFPVPIDRYIKNIEKIFEKGFIVETTGLNIRDLKSLYYNDTNKKFQLLSWEIWGRIFIWKENYSKIVIE